MDGLLWLLGSWLLVGLLCYFFILKLGEPKPVDSHNGPIYASRLASSHKEGKTSEEWINPIIEWLFKITHHTPAPLMAWICALNDASRRLTNPESTEILFEDFGDHAELKAMPKLSEIQVEKGPGDHLTLKTKISVPLVVVRLVASQKVKDRLAVTNYDAHICDLYGEIEARIACIAGEIYLMSCFNGRPEMEIFLQDREPDKHVELNEQIVSEAIRRCVVTAVTNINLSQHEREIEEHRLRPDQNASPIQEMVKRLSSSYTPTFGQQRTANKLYVKVIRAEGLGANQAVDAPFVVIEMDEPVQKYATSRQSTAYPYWDEEFVLKISDLESNSIQSSKKSEEEYVYSDDSDAGISDDEEQDTNTTSYLAEDMTPADRQYQQNYNILKEVILKWYQNNWASLPPSDLKVPFKSYDPKDDPIDIGILPASEIDCFLLFMPDFLIENDLNPASDEILFEIYDGSQEYPDSDDKFLGLAIVGFKEIPPSGESLQALPLLTRPYRNDRVSGNLIVQFKFYHDPDAPVIGSETHEAFITNDYGAKVSESQTTRRQQIDKIYDIQDDEFRFTPTKTTTVLVKTVSQDTGHQSVPPSQDRMPITLAEPELEPDDVWRMNRSLEQQSIPVTPNETMPEEPVPYKTPQDVPPYRPSKTVIPPFHAQKEEGRPSAERVVQEKLTASPVIRRSGSAKEGRDVRESTVESREGRPETKDQERSRKTSKKRDHSFFEELRRRLSGSLSRKRRAKSVDIENKHMEEAYASMPASRDASMTRTSRDGREISAARSIGGEVTTRRSTLIYEVHKGGENIYYQVPPAVASDPEALKVLGRGKKLHIHNGHTFVAVKTKGGVSCNTCNSRIASSFHKQAYQCRDCRYIRHKSCHADTLAPCQYSSLDKLKIEKDIDWVHFLAHQQLQEYISVDGV